MPQQTLNNGESGLQTRNKINGNFTELYAGKQSIGRSIFSNASYTVLATDVYVAQVGTLSASRTVTLPAANAVPAGYSVVIADESGTATSANSIVVQRAGSDTINGGTSTTIAAAYGFRRLVSDGNNKWTFDAGAARLGTVGLYTAQQNFALVTLADAAGIDWNLNTAQVASVTLGGNRTLNNPTNMVAGGTYLALVRQDATGSRTLSYGNAYKWVGGTPPVLSTTANSVDILSFLSDGTNMYGSIQKGFA